MQHAVISGYNEVVETSSHMPSAFDSPGRPLGFKVELSSWVNIKKVMM
jgi:hypothetical protein